MPLSEAYLHWNRAIAEYYRLDATTGNDVYLTITPRILAAAISEYRREKVSPDRATKDFIKTVSEVYRTEVKRLGLKLSFHRIDGQDSYPKCIAFLALTVLAAYEMRSDEEGGANAYYKRLGDLLGCELDRNYPELFDPLEFEALWKFLQKHSRVASVEPELGNRRYIAYPLTHVPLRQIDVEKLPEFFAIYGYEPESNVSQARIEADLDDWGKGCTFSKPGKAALNDRRRQAVIAEIAHELNLWDGSFTGATGRRTTTIEVLLDTLHRYPQLYYLPRRPLEFPEIFDDGVNHFESNEEGWYSPAIVTPDRGEALLKGFLWESTVNRTQFALKREGAGAIGLVSSPNCSYSGYLSRRKLIRGIPCSVLVHESLLEQAKDYLPTITNSQLKSKSHPKLPNEWSLFSNLIVERCPEFLPPELSNLDVESNADIITVGGLKIGRKNSWLLGSPPRLIVTGIDPGQQPKIDGLAVNIGEDGSLIDEDRALSRPGHHFVQVGSFSKKIEIVEPEISEVSVEWIVDRANTDDRIALPGGRWKLIGINPGELFEANSKSGEDFIVDCPFSAFWAVSINKQLQMIENKLGLEDLVPGFRSIKIKDFHPSKCNPNYPALKTIASCLGCQLDDLARLSNEQFLQFIDKDIPIKVIALKTRSQHSIARNLSLDSDRVKAWIYFIHHAGTCESEITALYSQGSKSDLKRDWQNYSFEASKIIWGAKR